MFSRRSAISLCPVSIRSFRFRSLCPCWSRARSVGYSDPSASCATGKSGAGGGLGRLHDAVSHFDAIVQMRPLPPVKEFSRVLSVVVRMRHYSAAISLIKEMGSRRVGLNVYIWGILMNCLYHLRRVELGLAVLGRVLKLGFKANSVMLNTLINSLCKGGGLDRAVRLADEMGDYGLKPSAYTYATILKGASGKEDRGLVMELLRKWERQNCRLNVVAYNTVIDLLCKDGLVSEALSLCKDTVSRGVDPNTNTIP